MDKLVTYLQIKKCTSTFQVGRNSGGNMTNSAGMKIFRLWHCTRCINVWQHQDNFPSDEEPQVKHKDSGLETRQGIKTVPKWILMSWFPSPKLTANRLWLMWPETGQILCRNRSGSSRWHVALLVQKAKKDSCSLPWHAGRARGLWEGLTPTFLFFRKKVLPTTCLSLLQSSGPAFSWMNMYRPALGKGRLFMKTSTSWGRTWVTAHAP